MPSKSETPKVKKAKAGAPAKTAKAAKAAKVTADDKPKRKRDIFPAATTRRALVSYISDPDVLRRIAELKAERKEIEPEAARTELRESDANPPTNRKITEDLMHKHATAAHVKRWIEINDELAELKNSPGQARGNKDAGEITSRLVEWILMELLKTLTAEAYKQDKVRLSPKFLADAQEGVECLPFMPLLLSLDSWMKLTDEEEGEGEEHADANADDDGEQSNEEDEDEEDEDDEDADVHVIMKTRTAFKKLNDALKEKTGYVTNIRQRLYDFVADLVADLITNIAAMSRVLLEFKNQRTIKEEIIQVVIRMVYVEYGMAEQGDKLLRRISTVYQREEIRASKDDKGAKEVIQERIDGEKLGKDLDGVEALPKAEAKKAKPAKVEKAEKVDAAAAGKKAPPKPAAAKKQTEKAKAKKTNAKKAVAK
jgi:hypothetical protein